MPAAAESGKTVSVDLSDDLLSAAAVTNERCIQWKANAKACADAVAVTVEQLRESGRCTQRFTRFNRISSDVSHRPDWRSTAPEQARA